MKYSTLDQQLNILESIEYNGDWFNNLKNSEQFNGSIFNLMVGDLENFMTVRNFFFKRWIYFIRNKRIN